MRFGANDFLSPLRSSSRSPALVMIMNLLREHG